MKKFEYITKSPHIINGYVVNGYKKEVKTGLFGKQSKESVPITIKEEEWLDKMGAEGWELVTVLRNGMSYDIKDYYFKREISNL